MKLETLSALAFAIISILLALDIWDDLAHGADYSHVILELVAFVICFFVLGERIRDYLRSRVGHYKILEQELNELRVQRESWRIKAKESLQNLSQIIDEQFEQWHLTPAEKEVGLLILKGLSHKEIAEIRNSSERTVRQQAAAIYSKGGLSGKGHLSAFFLEDLMIPT